MKIRLSLPNMDSKYLKHDAPLIRAVSIGILAFVAISSLTVFAGIKSHIAGYLDGLHPYLAWTGYSLGYLAFSLAPDVLNMVAVGFVARSFLLGFFKDRRSIVLIVVCVATSFFLTKYSYNMSQMSAGALSQEITPEVASVDLEKIDNTYNSLKENIASDYEKEYQRINSEFDTLIARSNRVFEAQKAPFFLKEKALEKSRKPTNTQWIDKQIAKQQAKVQPIEEKRVAVAAKISAEKRQALKEIRNRRQLLEDNAQTASDTTKTVALRDQRSKAVTIASITEVLSRELSGIAGKAVFILIGLTVIREVLRNRNDIQPMPVFSQFDFQASAIWEVLLFPLSFLGTHILSRVRNGYQSLKKISMPPPHAPGTLYDWTTANHEIADFESSNSLKENAQKQPQKQLNGSRRSTKRKSDDFLKEKVTLPKNAPYENRIYETKIVKTENLKECAHCGVEFVYNHKKQKYCTDDCRKKAWEKRNGRKLKLKAKKK